MRDQPIRPRFATLQYSVLEILDISISEYFYLDMVYHLSRDSWCYKSLDSVAADMRITKNGVFKMRERLIHRKLLLKDEKGRVRTSVTYNSVYLEGSERYTKYNARDTKYNAGVQLSITKNNNRTKEENSSLFNFNSNGTPSLAAVEARIARSASKVH